MIRSAFALMCVAALVALGLNAARADESLGTIHGKIKAKGHKEVLAKWARERDRFQDDDAPDSKYDSPPKGSTLPPGVINYANISSMYVIIEDATYKGGKFHNLVITRNGIVPKALAVAVNDVIRVRNELPEYLNVYIAGDGDDGDLGDVDGDLLGGDVRLGEGGAPSEECEGEEGEEEQPPEWLNRM